MWNLQVSTAKPHIFLDASNMKFDDGGFAFFAEEKFAAIFGVHEAVFGKDSGAGRVL